MFFNTSNISAWILLFVAGIFETVWAVSLKYSDGLTRIWPTIITLLSMFISIICLSQAIKMIPLGTAYVVWTGIGAIGTVLFGILWIKEPATAMRLICLFLIVIGIVGLNLSN